MVCFSYDFYANNIARHFRISLFSQALVILPSGFDKVWHTKVKIAPLDLHIEHFHAAVKAWLKCHEVLLIQECWYVVQHCSRNYPFLHLW